MVTWISSEYLIRGGCFSALCQVFKTWSKDKIKRLNLGFPRTKNILFQLPSPEYREETKISTITAKLIISCGVWEDEDLHCSFLHAPS